MDRGVWLATVHGVLKESDDLVTKQQVQILAEPIDKRKISILLKPLCLADIPRQVDNTRIPIKAASAD